MEITSNGSSKDLVNRKPPTDGPLPQVPGDSSSIRTTTSAKMYQFTTTQELEGFSTINLSNATRGLEEFSSISLSSSIERFNVPTTVDNQVIFGTEADDDYHSPAYDVPGADTSFDPTADDVLDADESIESISADVLEVDESFDLSASYILDTFDPYTPPRKHHEYRRIQIANRRDSRRFVSEYDEDPIQLPAQVEKRKPTRRTHVGPWRLGKTLGKGSTGRIRLVRHERTGQYGAVKIMTKEHDLQTTVDNGDGVGSAIEQWTNAMEREVIIMKMVRHPHVVQMYDVWETRRELYLILEYVEGGDLFEYILERKPLSEREVMRLFLQLMSGVEYCHSFSICHRDLKPENILMDSSNNLRIADFGFAALQPPGWKLARSCGTPHYAAPEIIAGHEYDGAPADIWSCGIILFALFAGHVPFDHEDTRVILHRVKIGRFQMPDNISPEARDLLNRMLTVDPAARITMRDIWTHPLLRKYYDENVLAKAKLPYGEFNIGRPLNSVDEIDPVILESLRSLWHGQSVKIVTDALMSVDLNQEKIFYALLQKYRDDHLEHYTGALNLQHTDDNGDNWSGTSPRPGHNGGALKKKGGKPKVRKSSASVRLKKRTNSDTKLSKKGRPISYSGAIGSQHIAPPSFKGKKEEGAQNSDAPRLEVIESGSVDITHGIPAKGDVPYLQNSPAKSIKVLSTVHKRGIIFQHSGSRFPNLREHPQSEPNGHDANGGIVKNQSTASALHKTDWEDIDTPVARTISPPPDDSHIVISKKEGMARKKNRMSTASMGTNAIGGSVRIIDPIPAPLRRRAKKFSEDFNEEIRKASNDLGEYCEEIFGLHSPRYSSAVLNETVAELELSRFSMDLTLQSPLAADTFTRASSLAIPQPRTRPLSEQSIPASLTGFEDQKYLAGYILRCSDGYRKSYQDNRGIHKDGPGGGSSSRAAPLPFLPGTNKSNQIQSIDKGPSNYNIKLKQEKQSGFDDWDIFEEQANVQDKHLIVQNQRRFCNDKPDPDIHESQQFLNRELHNNFQAGEPIHANKGKNRAGFEIKQRSSTATSNHWYAEDGGSDEAEINHKQSIRSVGRVRSELGEIDANSQRVKSYHGVKTEQENVRQVAANPQVQSILGMPNVVRKPAPPIPAQENRPQVPANLQAQSVAGMPTTLRKPVPPIPAHVRIQSKKASGRTISMTSLSSLCGPVPDLPELNEPVPEPVLNDLGLSRGLPQPETAIEERLTAPTRPETSHHGSPSEDRIRIERAHNRSAPLLNNYRQPVRNSKVQPRATSGQYYISRCRQANHNSVGNFEQLVTGYQDFDHGSLHVPKKRNILSKLGGLLSSVDNSDSQPIQEKRFWSGSSVPLGSGTRNISAATKDSSATTGSKFLGIWGRTCKKEIEDSDDIPVRPPTANLYTPSYWEEHDDASDVSYEPVQHAKPGWLQRVLKIVPVSHMLCFHLNAIATRREVLKILSYWNYGKRGIVDVKENKRQGTITARVTKHNLLGIRPVSFMIEIRPCGGVRRAPGTVVRITQVKGAASSLNIIVEEIKTLSNQNGLLETIPARARDMEMVFRPIRLS